MNERRRWLRSRARSGWLILLAGLALLLGSIVAAQLNPNVDFNFRMIGGLGILIAGIGLTFVMRYGAALGNDEAARRIIVEERDERSVQIRQRAGSRAYWASATLVFAGLMWSSFAASGQLAAIEGDGLWNFLAAATVVPLAIYIGSVFMDERSI